MVKAYKVEEVSIGNKSTGDKIIFASMEDMEQAYKDVDNGKDIYVIKECYVTKFLNSMISSKIYDGSIMLSAKANQEDLK